MAQGQAISGWDKTAPDFQTHESKFNYINNHKKCASPYPMLSGDCVKHKLVGVDEDPGHVPRVCTPLRIGEDQRREMWRRRINTRTHTTNTRGYVVRRPRRVYSLHMWHPEGRCSCSLSTRNLDPGPLVLARYVRYVALI